MGLGEEQMSRLMLVLVEFFFIHLQGTKHDRDLFVFVSTRVHNVTGMSTNMAMLQSLLPNKMGGQVNLFPAPAHVPAPVHAPYQYLLNLVLLLLLQLLCLLCMILLLQVDHNIIVFTKILRSFQRRFQDQNSNFAPDCEEMGAMTQVNMLNPLNQKKPTEPPAMASIHLKYLRIHNLS